MPPYADDIPVCWCGGVQWCGLSDDGAIKVEQITPGPLETTAHWAPASRDHGHGHWRVESGGTTLGRYVMYAVSSRGC